MRNLPLAAWVGKSSTQVADGTGEASRTDTIIGLVNSSIYAVSVMNKEDVSKSVSDDGIGSSFDNRSPGDLHLWTLNHIQFPTNADSGNGYALPPANQNANPTFWVHHPVMIFGQAKHRPPFLRYLLIGLRPLLPLAIDPLILPDAAWPVILRPCNPSQGTASLLSPPPLKVGLVQRSDYCGGWSGWPP